MKRFVLPLALAALCLIALPALSEAYTLDGVTYRLDDYSVTITGLPEGQDSIVLHGRVGGQEISMLYVEEGLHNGVREIVLAEDVERLFSISSDQWPTLERLVIPVSLTELSLYDSSFRSVLREYAVDPAHPEYSTIDGVLFSRDGRTLIAYPSARGEHYDIPEGTEQVDFWAFYNSETLRSVTLPQSVTAMTDQMFSRAERLERIDIPASVTSVTRDAFPYSDAFLEVIVAPDNPVYESRDGMLYRKADHALVFYPAGKATDVELPADTLAIDSDAFRYNGAVRRLTIPEGVTAIEEESFRQCTALESIVIPASVRTIGDRAMPYNEVFREIVVAPENPVYASRDGMLFRTEDSRLLCYPAARGTSCDIPPGTLAIDSEAFFGNSALESVTIPRGVTVIETGTFSYHCSALERVSLPITLERIERDAFSECISLTRLAFPAGMKTIGPAAFLGCEALREIVFPDGMEDIDITAFGHTSDDLIVYAGEGTEGHHFARTRGLPWAPPGGEARRLERSSGEIAVVNNASAEDLLSLHAGPSESSEVLGRYPNGSTLEVTATENGWSAVRIGPTRGYMRSDLLTRVNHLSGIVELSRGEVSIPDGSDWMKLYAYPSYDAPTVEPYDTFTVHILDVVGPWYYVTTHDQTGYLPAEMAEVYRKDDTDGERYGIVVNPDQRDRLHLRAGTSTSSNSLGRYFTGTQVEIVSNYGEWYQVHVDQKAGYMKAEFVRPVLVEEPELSPNG
ncbi:leucine-rich repeat protein [Eubacteriales bacterium OttesenSCG-928-A19]|nr:leucine-rich repeat protein [Eubacteriales bacterium OttesenSCG-928-A19]